MAILKVRMILENLKKSTKNITKCIINDLVILSNQ